MGFGLGVAGILYSGFLVSAIFGMVLAIWLVREVGLRFSRAILLQLRSFGVPYQISTAGSFFLVFGDRFFLGYSRSIGEVGLYGLAYQFGFLLGSLVELPFFRAWNPERFLQSGLPRAERDASYNEGLSLLNVFLVLTATGIVLFTPAVIRLATTAEFHSAAAVVPVIVAAYVVQCYTMVVAFGIDVSTRTKYYTYATWSSVLVIAVLYAVLIPPYGGFGAAWATLLAFVVRFALTYFFAQRLWPVKYSWAGSLRATAIGIAVVVARTSLTPAGVFAELALSTLLLGLCAFGIWTVGLRPGERHTVRGMVSRLAARRGGQRSSIG